MAFNSAYLFPNEGLNYLLNITPRNINTAPATTYLGLFTTSWATITGTYTSNVTLNATAGGSANFVQEASFAGYGRQAIPSTSWGAGTGTSFTVSGTVSGQATTTNSGYVFTASGSATVYGIFVATTSPSGVTSSGTGANGAPTVFWYAPFSDLNSVTLASGDTLTVTPTWQFASNAG